LTGPPPFDWFDWVQKGGFYCSPLLLAAIFWLNGERIRLLKKLDDKDEDLKAAGLKVEALAERSIAVFTEVKHFLFTERKA
jgi:hypothetical protein